MKKSLLILSVFLTLQSNAQFLNTNFESWTNKGGYEVPNGWATSDEMYTTFGITGLSYPTSVIKETSSYSGTYALKVQNVSGTYNGNILDTISGFAIVCHNDGDNFFEGFAFSQRPAALTGYYKFTQGGNGVFPNIDTAAIVVNFSKWNATGKVRETVGRAAMMIFSNTPSFTPFSLEVEYLNGTVPDSANVIIMSSSGKVHYPGTILTVDELAFTGVGVLGTKYPLLRGEEPLLYPNPAAGQVAVKNIPKEATLIRIRDVAGQEVKEVPVSTEHIHISTSDLPMGIYFYYVTDAEDRILYVNTFNIMN